MPAPPPSTRTAAVATAVINALVNPLLEIVLNRGGFQPLPAVAVNLAITSVVMCVLVSAFARRGLGRGLRYGVSAAFVTTACLVLLSGTGLSGLPFGTLLAVKAVYCGALAYRVAR